MKENNSLILTENSEEQQALQETWDALQAVPSYVERPLGDEDDKFMVIGDNRETIIWSSEVTGRGKR